VNESSKFLRTLTSRELNRCIGFSVDGKADQVEERARLRERLQASSAERTG
jgi:hypothetical protein